MKLTRKALSRGLPPAALLTGGLLAAVLLATAACAPGHGSVGVSASATRAPARVTLPTPVEGEAYAWSATDLQGRALGSEALAGKVVVLDFWATWCPTCVYGLPKLEALHEAYGDDGLEIVGVSFDSEPDTLATFAEDRGLGWSHVFVGNDRDAVVQATGVGAIPRYFVLDRRGVLVSADAKTHELKDLVKQLLSADA